MKKKLRSSLSLLLSFVMVFSVFAIVPITASAEVGGFVPESEYLTFTAEEAGSSVTLNVSSGSDLQYNKNNSGWQSYTAGAQIDLASAGDSVRFRGKDTTFDDSNFVSIGGKVACSGNVMSLRLDDNGMVQGLSDLCFYCMFMGCTGLTAAPKLPETTLAGACYSYMFYGCTSLTTAPALPATNLADSCYYGMFYECENLTTAPKLPATTLANECYNSMFEGCKRLTTAPELPATTLAQYCYYHMFAGCSSIKLSETQTAEYSIPYSVPSGGNGTTASAALTGMFANTGGTFKGTPTINTTYYRPLEKYTVTWKNGDGTILETDTDVAEGSTPSYDGIAPEKAEDAENTYTFSGWSDGTNTYGVGDNFPAVNGDVTYTAQFDATPKAHQHDGITFEKWTSDNSLPTEAGNYVLTSDVTLSGTWTVPAGETNLCLAGHTIRQSGSGSVILLNNANEKLTVYDDGTTGAITGGNTNGTGGGVNITAGTFTLKGGNIEGNVANNGGGVSVNGSSSYFTMAGGTIRYNSGYGNTGGVLLVSTDNFTMTGGEIRYNVGRNFGGIGIANAHPNMSGTAVVKDNVVFNDTSASNTKITKTESGYTLAEGGTPCDIKDSTVNGLTINVVGAFESGAQIGIFNNNQTAEFTSGFDANNPGSAPADYFFSNDSNRFVMLSANKEAQLGGYFTVTWKDEDGTVLETDENVSTGTPPEFNGTEPTKESDGVATFEFIGWTPAVSPVTGDVVYTATYKAVMPDQEHDGIVYKAWTSKNSLPTEAGNYYLGYDVTLPSTWTVSKNIRLCLNGNGITKNGGNVITIVGGGNLTIDDCGTTTHYFDVNNGKAVNVNTTSGEKSFTGGYITGGTGQGYDGYFWSEGGGIYLDGGNLILNGGTILGNSASFGGGVGIFSGTMTMNGGTVCYNTGNAGISFRTGSNDYNRGRGASTGYFIMNGGLVTNNSSGVTTAGYSYGNDYVTLNGGTIANNVNTGVYSRNLTIAGDVEITGNKDGAGFSNTCSISGNPVITGNTNSNLSINNGKTINTGALGENAKIGIKMSNPGVFTNGYDANNTIDPNEIFTVDDPTTFIEKNANGEIRLGIYVWTASFNAGVGSGTMDSIEVQKERSFNLPECTFTAPEGKLFLNWSDGTNTYNPGDSFTMTADTEFTAQWIDGIKVSFEANGGSGVMEDVISYPDYKLPACGFTAPEGKFFNGWLSSADNQVYQTGDTVTLTAETQFTAQWGREVKYQFDFEDGMPTDWQTSNNNWFLNNRGGDYDIFAAHSGQNNMTYFRGGYGTYGELLTSSFDLSNAESGTLGFYYTNRSWGRDIDQLTVSYKVGDGEWVPIFTTSGNHESWTKEEITLPSEAFAENVRFRFSANGNYGYGIALDDVELNLIGRKNLIASRSITLDGDIIINFNIDPSAAGLTPENIGSGKQLTVTFEWAKDFGNAEDKPKSDISKYNKTITVDSSNVGSKIPVSCPVCAAEMSCQVKATATLNGKTGTKVYSVRDYADSVINPREDSSFANLRDNNPTAYAKLVNLVSAMVDYGARAQKVFKINTSDLANKNLTDYEMEEVTDDMFVKAANNGAEASNMKKVAEKLGANYYTSSLIFLDRSTLRHYFTKKDSTFNPSLFGNNHQNNTYYYVEETNIPAHELDKLQEFKIGNTTFYYSALDYARALNASSAATADMKDLAKSLYWYSRAAKGYIS